MAFSSGNVTSGAAANQSSSTHACLAGRTKALISVCIAWRCEASLNAAALPQGMYLIISVTNPVYVIIRWNGRPSTDSALCASSPGAQSPGELARGLSVIANYSYIANDYIKDNATPTRPSLEGSTPYGIPKHQASVWARYQLQSGPLAGMGVAAGARYLGTSSGGTHDAFKVPAATLVDAAMDYDLGRANPSLKGMSVALNITNLFDKEYVASCYSEEWCWYGYQRSVRASLRYRW